MQPLALFKALSDDTRLRILLLIVQEQELCVCELTCALGLSQPKISRHLALLRQLAILSDRRQGQWVFYQLHPQLDDWAETILQQTLSANQALLSHNQQQLAQMGDRPERSSQCCIASC